MKVTAFIRKTAAKNNITDQARVYFRVRDIGGVDIKAASELSINPNTIQRAYAELERNGFIYSVKGRGSFVGSISRLREQKCRELEEKVAGLAVEAKSLGMDKTAFVRMAEEQFGGEKTV